MNPTYETSPHYAGESGERYFSWQAQSGGVAGILNARKFAPYVGPELVVLDFGCGGGYLLKHLACARKIGIEVNPAARRAAHANGIEVYESLHELDDEVVDVIISNHALEHVPFPIEVLRQAKAKLKASGTLVIVVPIDDWRTQRVFKATDINHHLQTWTPQLFGNMLVEAGFHPNAFSIRILHHAWLPSYYGPSKTLPRPVFDCLCCLTSIALRRRQLIAVARQGK